MTDKKIAVIGCGAIGGSVSADLAEAGLDVTVIDQWPEQVETVRTDGLRVTMPDREVHVKLNAIHLHQLASIVPSFDIVFLIVKSYDTRWLVELIKPYLKEDGVVVGLQNGMNNDAIASIVGRERTIGSVVELSAEIYEPGILQRDTPRNGTWFALGELDGSITPRLKEIKSIMDNVARIDISEHIEDAKWTKLIANTMTMGPYGLFGLKNWVAKDLPGMMDISVALGRESMAVGKALGYEVQPVFGLTAEEFSGSSNEILVTAITTLMGHVGRNGTTAPLHDHIKGRKSEMDLISGLVTRNGKEHGIRTPCNDAIVEIDRQINEGETPMCPENFELLKNLINRAHNK
ncbi:MAG: NAD(P)-binding domain-containing protein [Proteobacteria bacterium]|nr:NAD(P)-binding domain-containing protein [Pseudomonadota bacterium]